MMMNNIQTAMHYWIAIVFTKQMDLQYCLIQEIIHVFSIKQQENLNLTFFKELHACCIY